MILYTLLGGIEAVIGTDVLQSVVLTVGLLIAAIIAVVTGVTLILWATLSKPELKVWPETWEAVRNPLHSHLTIVAGTLAIFLVGILVSKIWHVLTGPKPAKLTP